MRDLAAHEARKGGGSPREHLAQAILSLERAGALDPASPSVYRIRATVRQHMAELVARDGGDPVPIYRQAIDDCQKGRALDPVWARATPAVEVASGQLQLALGDALARHGTDPGDAYRAAVEATTRALAIQEGESWRFMRAVAHARLARLAAARTQDPTPHLRGAVDDLTHNLKTAPGHPSATRWHGSRYGLLRSLISRGPERAADHALAGRDAIALRRWSEAAGHLEAAIRLDPGRTSELTPLLERARSGK